MVIKPITVEEVKEPLSPQERQEVDRDDFRIPLEFFLEGMNTNPQTSEEAREGALLKVRSVLFEKYNFCETVFSLFTKPQAQISYAYNQTSSYTEGNQQGRNKVIYHHLRGCQLVQKLPYDVM